jgi:hypothetical protein
MVKKVVILMIFFLSSLSIISEKIGTLKEINKPRLMAISRNHLFISEKTSIYVYSLKGKEILKVFGKEGEGPNEFKISHGEAGIKIDIYQNQLLVNSAAKLTYYTYTGDFIKEQKVPPLIYFIPAGEKFVGNGLFKSKGQFPNLAIFLWEGDFRTKKPIFISDIPIGMGAKFIVPAYNFKYIVNQDKIFLAKGKEKIEIILFNTQGKELYHIKKEGMAIPLSNALKSEIKNFYKTDPGYKDYWQYYKNVIIFPKYLPGLKDFIVDGNKIYVQTHEEKDHQYKWIIFDIKGKEIRSTYLPIGKTSPVAASPLTIHQNKYYYLKEDLEEETWDLFSVDLSH